MKVEVRSVQGSREWSVQCEGAPSATLRIVFSNVPGDCRYYLIGRSPIDGLAGALLQEGTFEARWWGPQECRDVLQQLLHRWYPGADLVVPDPPLIEE